ncbi:MAG: metal-dependent hydrolase [Planctomycetota bacterium]
MASAFGHALVAVTIGKQIPYRNPPFIYWILGIYCANIPDLDVLSFAFVAYGHFFGHRGFTHSIVFALLLAWGMSVLFLRQRKSDRKLFFLYLFLCTVSHPILDAMTNGGLGVAFFSPFENSRYFFPWRPIQVSPIGGAFFSIHGVRVIQSEFLYIGLPCIIALLYVRVRRRNKGYL